ncbi:hypothetical protein ACWC2K_19460 [Streptomyces chattanoogensis]
MEDVQTSGNFDRNARRTAGIALALLVPTVIGSMVAAVSGPEGARCFEYGECHQPPPGPSALSVLSVSVAAGVLGLAWPRRFLPFATARAVPVAVQLIAHVLLPGRIFG